MKFKDYFAPKQIIFAIVLFAILIPFAIRDSNNQVKVRFDDTSVYTTSNKYSMTVQYDQIESIQLVPLAEPGEKVENGYDDDILRAGMWHNDTWGDYHITADLDTTNCVVMTLDDGRIFVFSRKSNTETETLFEELQSRLGS